MQAVCTVSLQSLRLHPVGARPSQRLACPALLSVSQRRRLACRATEEGNAPASSEQQQSSMPQPPVPPPELGLDYDRRQADMQVGWDGLPGPRWMDC